MEEIRDWYVANTGYVLQLARPFYEELTVRDNLTLAAEIKLPVSSKFTTKEKFKRVEQVLEVVGILLASSISVVVMWIHSFMMLKFCSLGVTECVVSPTAILLLK